MAIVGELSRMNWPDVPELYSLLDCYEERWKLTYPGLEITREVMRAAEWCAANPARKPKKRWHRFMVLWLARNQAALERIELREQLQQAQRRADASVGLWEGYRK